MLGEGVCVCVGGGVCANTHSLWQLWKAKYARVMTVAYFQGKYTWHFATSLESEANNAKFSCFRQTMVKNALLSPFVLDISIICTISNYNFPKNKRFHNIQFQVKCNHRLQNSKVQDHVSLAKVFGKEYWVSFNPKLRVIQDHEKTHLRWRQYRNYNEKWASATDRRMMLWYFEPYLYILGIYRCC